MFSIKNNKNHQIKALELHIIIFPQNMHGTYFFLESTLHKKINKTRTIFFWALYDLLYIYQENNNFND
jgi:hypothetical protein